MTNPYLNKIAPQNGYTRCIAVAGDNGNDLESFGAIYIETGGNIKFTTEGGDVITLAVEDKTWLPWIVRRVWATGTTATGIYVAY